MGTVTLKELSNITGYSIRSVNRALKGQAGIGEDARKKILEAARKVGYTPNIAARNLRNKQSNFVGIIVPDNTIEASGKKLLALQYEYERAGFYPVVGLFDGDHRRLKKTLREWAGLVSTVVFVTWSEAIDPSRFLAGLPQRFIFIDCPVYGNSQTVISIDRSSGIRTGIKRLIEKGHQRIARCGNMRSSRSGFDDAFASAVDCEKIFVQTRGIEFEDGYTAGPGLMNKKVEAVFFDTDRMALGFYKYVQENGISIPEQIAVIGFDDDTAGQYAFPSLSTVAHPITEISRKTVELTKSSMSEPGQLILNTEFIQRESS
jgi:DNA-binding LacI/PurR family transcriptional regulator